MGNVQDSELIIPKWDRDGALCPVNRAGYHKKVALVTAKVVPDK